MLLLLIFSVAHAEPPAGEQVGFARLSYGGGGDWYNDPGILRNLGLFAREATRLPFSDVELTVALTDPGLSDHPMLYMTGHGTVRFNDDDARILREYLLGGGFLYADDDYGMDESFRAELRKVFPEKALVELPATHPLFTAWFDFSNGAPKIHKHHDGPPRVLGIEHEGRLIVLYTFDTNISDGWADADVHNDPPEMRRKALQFGVNILMVPFLP